MKEGDILFETGIGKLDNEWLWRARGHELERFCRAHEPDWLPLDENGWLSVGSYKTRRAAERDLKDFEDDFTEFLQEEIPGLEIKKASDPRSLN
jgi:hypothetical protein